MEYKFINKNLERKILTSKLFVFFIVFVLTVYLLTKNPDSLISTLGLLWIVVIGAVYKILSLKSVDTQKVLNYIVFFWGIKILFSFILLEFGWIPDLYNENSDSWGYDPQRFFLYSKNLVTNNWVITDYLNYQGITFFYAGIFYLFGANPFIPALINSIISLLISLKLIDFLKYFKIKFNVTIFAFLFLLFPEAVWFDILTSREMLLASLLTLIVLEFLNIIFSKTYINYWKAIIYIISGIFFISVLRMTVIIPVFLFFIILLLTTSSPNKIGFIKFILFSIIIAIPFVAPIFNSYLGGFNTDYLELLETTTKSSENVAQGFEFSNNSIAVLLMPNGLLESILFLPLRMILYLISPLPALNFSISSLYNGSYYAWQNMVVCISSGLNIILFPFSLAGFWDSIRNRNSNRVVYALHLAFFIILISIAGGNLIIHERYRIMAYPFMIVSSLIGYYNAPRNLKKNINVTWYAFLFLASCFYFVYKFTN